MAYKHGSTVPQDDLPKRAFPQQARRGPPLRQPFRPVPECGKKQTAWSKRPIK